MKKDELPAKVGNSDTAPIKGVRPCMWNPSPSVLWIAKKIRATPMSMSCLVGLSYDLRGLNG